jgi:hypothetical protein
LRHAFEAVSQVPLDESWPRREGAIPARNPIRLFPAITKRIAKLDPELAYELTRQFGQTLEDGTAAFRKEEGIFRRNRAMLYVADTQVETDPARAAKIAAEVMARDAGMDFVAVLVRLQRVDRARADQLALAALDAISRRQPVDVEEYYSLGSYIFPDSRLPYAVSGQQTEKLPINATLAAKYLADILLAMQQHLQKSFDTIDWASQLEYIRRLDPQAERITPAEFQRITIMGSYSRAYQAMVGLRPYVSEYTLALMPLYETLFVQVGSKLSEQQRQATEEFQRYRKGPSSESLDELLAQAQRESSSQRRDQILAGAVDVAVKTKQFGRIEAILTQIGDLEIRRNMSELYHFRALEHHLGAGEMLEARRHAAALKKPELMVVAFAKMAESRHEAESDEARGYLAEGERLLGALPDSAEKARAWLRLASAYAPVDAAYAPILTRQALIQMGKTNAQLDDLDGVTIKWTALKGTIRETGRQGFGAGDLTATLDQLMTKLATEDFDGTLLTLAQVARGEVKLMAELVMVREGFRWIKQVSPKPEAAEKKAGTDEPLN